MIPYKKKGGLPFFFVFSFFLCFVLAVLLGELERDVLSTDR
jgi:hypothetical protein